eukprot:6197131-Pleurochrysis_carterae.AAC.1
MHPLPHYPRTLRPASPTKAAHPTHHHRSLRLPQSPRARVLSACERPPVVEVAVDHAGGVPRLRDPLLGHGLKRQREGLEVVAQVVGDGGDVVALERGGHFGRGGAPHRQVDLAARLWQRDAVEVGKALRSEA